VSRSILIDPALKGLGGHHFNVAIALSRAAISVGHQMVWIAHKDADTTLVPDNVRLVPAFSSTLYQNQIGIAGRVLRPIVGDRHFLRKVLRERSWEVYLRRKIPSRMFDGDRIAEFAAALQIQRPTPRDRLIVHSGSPQTVNILTTWASRRPQSTHPSFHIRTCWSKSNMPFADYAGGFAKAIERLVSVARRVTLCCETDDGARELAHQTGMDVGVCPHFADTSFWKDNDRSDSFPGRLVVGWLGDPRQEKGAALLPHIIRQALHSGPNDKFKFLLQSGGKKKRWLSELHSNLDEFGNAVELLPSAISREAYLDALHRCDIILLPYDPQSYPPERGSGLAVESVLAGKPIVAMADTFAAGLVTPESGVIATDAASLAKGLVHIAANIGRFQAGARREQQSARSKYDPVRLYSQLIGLETK
jgi:glycosyltransferase involved in cell wall biosynthesis